MKKDLSGETPAGLSFMIECHESPNYHSGNPLIMPLLNRKHGSLSLETMPVFRAT